MYMMLEVENFKTIGVVKIIVYDIFLQHETLLRLSHYTYLCFSRCSSIQLLILASSSGYLALFLPVLLFGVILLL